MDVVRKVDWAEKHLERLRRLLRAYTRVPPYTPLITEQSGQVGTESLPVLIVTATEVKPVPAAAPLLVGDFVHNLRVSLDYLARQIVLLSGEGPDNGTAFRIWGTFPTEKKWLHSDGKAKLISPRPRDDLYEVVEGLQPYQRAERYRSHPLHVLNKLDVADKHHELSIMSSTGREWRTEVQCANGESVVSTYRIGAALGGVWRRVPLKDGTIIAHILVDDLPAPPVKVKSDVEVVVTLGELGSIQDEVVPLADYLQALLDFVRQDVIEVFEPFFNSHDG